MGLLLEMVAFGAVVMDIVGVSGRSPYHHLLLTKP